MTTIQKLKVYPWHPYLVCLYCIIKANADLQISMHYWPELLGLLVIFWGITGILQGAFQFVWSSNIKGSIALSPLLFLNFFLLPLHKTVIYIFPFDDHIRFSFAIFAILWLVLAFFLFIKKKKNYQSINRYLIIVLLIFCVIDISKWCYDALFATKDIAFEQSTHLKTEKKYNIYLIVPDGYASNENLLKYWYFDNSTFVSDLKNKGFFVAQNPHSNYRYTMHSVSTMLNLNYWTTLTTEPFLEAKIADNTLMHFLSTQKYHCRIFDHGKRHYEFNANAVRLNLKNYLFRQSAIYSLGYFFKFYIDFSSTPTERNDDAVFQYIKNDLESTNSDTIRHQFGYYHSMITHYPFKDKAEDVPNKDLMKIYPLPLNLQWATVLFNHSRTLGTQGDSLLMNEYLLKVKQTNDSLQTILNRYWNNIKEKSIVIIMSDHGFRTMPGQPVDFQSEAYSNFCAVYFPDKDYTTLTDTITPINVVRMAVNKAVGTNLPYLPDKTNLK